MLPNTDNSGRRISSVSDNRRTAASPHPNYRRDTGKKKRAVAAASTMLLLVFVQTSLLVGVLRAPAGALADTAGALADSDGSSSFSSASSVPQRRKTRSYKEDNIFDHTDIYGEDDDDYYYYDSKKGKESKKGGYYYGRRKSEKNSVGVAWYTKSAKEEKKSSKSKSTKKEKEKLYDDDFTYLIPDTNTQPTKKPTRQPSRSPHPTTTNSSPKPTIKYTKPTTPTASPVESSSSTHRPTLIVGPTPNRPISSPTRVPTPTIARDPTDYTANPTLIVVAPTESSSNGGSSGIQPRPTPNRAPTVQPNTPVTQQPTTEDDDDDEPEYTCRITKAGSYGDIDDPGGVATIVDFVYEVQVIPSVTVLELNTEMLPKLEVDMGDQILPQLFPADCQLIPTTTTQTKTKTVRTARSGRSSSAQPATTYFFLDEDDDDDDDDDDSVQYDLQRPRQVQATATPPLRRNVQQASILVGFSIKPRDEVEVTTGGDPVPCTVSPSYATEEFPCYVVQGSVTTYSAAALTTIEVFRIENIIRGVITNGDLTSVDNQFLDVTFDTFDTNADPPVVAPEPKDTGLLGFGLPWWVFLCIGIGAVLLLAVCGGLAVSLFRRHRQNYADVDRPTADDDNHRGEAPRGDDHPSSSNYSESGSPSGGRILRGGRRPPQHRTMDRAADDAQNNGSSDVDGSEDGSSSYDDSSNESVTSPFVKKAPQQGLPYDPNISHINPAYNPDIDEPIDEESEEEVESERYHNPNHINLLDSNHNPDRDNNETAYNLSGSDHNPYSDNQQNLYSTEPGQFAPPEGFGILPSGNGNDIGSRGSGSGSNGSRRSRKSRGSDPNGSSGGSRDIFNGGSSRGSRRSRKSSVGSGFESQGSGNPQDEDIHEPMYNDYQDRSFGQTIEASQSSFYSEHYEDDNQASGVVEQEQMQDNSSYEDVEEEYEIEYFSERQLEARNQSGEDGEHWADEGMMNATSDHYSGNVADETPLAFLAHNAQQGHKTSVASLKKKWEH